MTIITCAAMLVARTDLVKYWITRNLMALEPGCLANLTPAVTGQWVFSAKVRS
jgi:hypothetical protein